jgi:hypothetical protein
MEIDFRLRNEGRGLVMQLVPGRAEDEIALRAQVFIAEEAFGFIEPCVGAGWPAYKNYGHWGVSEIPVAVWRGIAADMEGLRSRLNEARGFEEVAEIGYLSDITRDAFRADFARLRGRVAAFIEALLTWLKSHWDVCTHITVIGI